jgi:O-antigen/teichoic acid export membrane protein
MLDLDAAGAFRALQNFMLPMMQILTAISTLALPSIAFAFGKKNYIGMRRKGFIIAGLLLIFSTLYIGFLFFFASSLENLLYAGKYKEYVELIPVVGVIPLITAVETGFSLIVRSLQRPIYHTILTFGMAVAGILSGLFLIPFLGIAGAIGSLVVSATISFCINIWFYRKWFSDIFLLWSNI